MKFNEKGTSKALLLIIAALFAMAASGGGVYYWQQQQWKKEKGEFEKKAQEQEKKISELEEKSKQEDAKKDEIADWKTYTNESFGISFKYPPTYKITKDSKPVEGKETAGSVTFSDTTRKGKPKLSLVFNPFGIGGCFPDGNDIDFKTKIQNGGLKVTSQNVGDAECGTGDISIYFNIGQYSKDTGKNGIFGTLVYAVGTDFEAELKQIIGTIKITKENIYGQ